MQPGNVCRKGAGYEDIPLLLPLVLEPPNASPWNTRGMDEPRKLPPTEADQRANSLPAAAPQGLSCARRGLHIIFHMKTFNWG